MNPFDISDQSIANFAIHVFLLILLASLNIPFPLKLKFRSIHMFQRDDKFQVNEIKRSQKIINGIVNLNFNCKLFPESMINPHPFPRQMILLIFNWSFERLDLKLFSPRGRDLDIIIFIEQQRDIVIIPSFHLFPSVLFNYVLFFGIEVYTVT